MKDNYQVETFDDKDKRDARYEALRGREGLVKLSIGEPVTVQELRKFPGHAIAKIKKGPKCGYTQRLVDVVHFIPTWAIAYPRILSKRTRERDRRIPTGSCPKKQRRSRYWRRHPKWHALAFGAQRKAQIKP